MLDSDHFPVTLQRSPSEIEAIISQCFDESDTHHTNAVTEAQFRYWVLHSTSSNSQVFRDVFVGLTMPTLGTSDQDMDDEAKISSHPVFSTILSEKLREWRSNDSQIALPKDAIDNIELELLLESMGSSKKEAIQIVDYLE